tara:strand:+ start:4342 stop:5226 length:885 start_codon:yes stop_codon:yes gene_type:complete
MKFLLAIGSKDFSGDTLHIGSQIALAFSAHLSIVYVGSKPKDLYLNRVKQAQENLEKWEIYHPGIDVLKWAFNKLKDTGFIKSKNSNDFNPANILESSGRYKMILPSTYGQKIDLILREGDLIEELRSEFFKEKYSIGIIGGSKERNRSKDILQFLPSSIFITNNFKIGKKYKILLCVDDSKATKNAVKFAIIIAKKLNLDVTLITVSKIKTFKDGYKNAVKNAVKILKKEKINFTQEFVFGDPVSSFVKYANDDHIIIMGDSSKTILKKFLFGSKSLATLKKTNSPILIVRNE